MAERMIPCPECIKRRASGLPLRWNLNCSTCGIEETKVGTIPDRRKPTASDRALRHLLNKVNAVTAPHRHGQPISKRRLDDLANAQLEYEEAERHE